MIYKLFQLKILNFEFFKVIFQKKRAFLQEKEWHIIFLFYLKILRCAISWDILTL